MSDMSQNEQIQLLRQEVKMVGRDIEEIKLAITGDTKLGLKGFVKRMDFNESDILSLKKWRDAINMKVAYTAGIVSGITFGGLEGLKMLVEALKHHP